MGFVGHGARIRDADGRRESGMTENKICVYGWNKTAGKFPYLINCRTAATKKDAKP